MATFVTRRDRARGKCYLGKNRMEPNGRMFGIAPSWCKINAAGNKSTENRSATRPPGVSREYATEFERPRCAESVDIRRETEATRSRLARRFRSIARGERAENELRRLSSLIASARARPLRARKSTNRSASRERGRENATEIRTTKEKAAPGIRNDAIREIRKGALARRLEFVAFMLRRKGDGYVERQFFC